MIKHFYRHIFIGKTMERNHICSDYSIWVIFIFLAMLFWNFLKYLPWQFSNKKKTPIHFESNRHKNNCR